MQPATASLGASTVGGAGIGAEALSDWAFNRPWEMSSPTASKTIQLNRLPLIIVFMAMASSPLNQFGITTAPLRAAI